ncbi:ufm1-specific protease 2-like isoform X2 [Stegodyphus dumicola]|nr:ufm1-specific protease 2-like isoform X2 [Stegodyphus dumicola]XP_035207917.1 ufm1-specific protease 2-like isoform X2 [Stegodyphus dumicola]
MAISASPDFFLPGLDVIGLFCMSNKEPILENEVMELYKKNIDLLKFEYENPLVLIVHKRREEYSSVKITAKLVTNYYGTFEDLEVEDLSYNPAVLLRASGQLPLLFEVSSDVDTLKENMEHSIERLRTTIQNEVAAFLLQNSNVIIHSSHDQTMMESSMTCKELLKLCQDEDMAEKVLKAKKNLKRKCPVNFHIFIQTSGNAAVENTVNHSVIIHCQRREFQCVSIALPLDVLVVAHEFSSTYAIYKLFISAVDKQLEKMNDCLLNNADFVTPVPYHFYPDMWDFPITVIYPLSKEDAELEKYRRHLHKLLLLPLDRPFLKKLNVYFCDSLSTGYLINPHEGLGASGNENTALVQGRYSYHHYMQDRMNDDGWGCAYRSLQTIISWFKFQGYTDKNIPTHTEIQQALVDIGDKLPSFVGSKKWIGSQEVSFCLDYLINVKSKIMCVSSGAELANKGRELFNHFQDQGTPVMIGGGVLAHTILGVDFNKSTGDLKFLILDPHYTGSEDLNVILNKGWCGWKTVQFWDESAFYNLCLPQRPKDL